MRVSFVSLLFCLMVFNATFNNISVISWRSVLLVEETGGPDSFRCGIYSVTFYHFSFLCCPFICSVLWCPLRFPHKNDLRFVLFVGWRLYYLSHLCLFAHMGVQHILGCDVFLFCCSSSCIQHGTDKRTAQKTKMIECYRVYTTTKWVTWLIRIIVPLPSVFK
jgi:hypothetical protein